MGGQIPEKKSHRALSLLIFFPLSKSGWKLRGEKKDYFVQGGGPLARSCIVYFWMHYVPIVCSSWILMNLFIYLQVSWVILHNAVTMVTHEVNNFKVPVVVDNWFPPLTFFVPGHHCIPCQGHHRAPCRVSRIILSFHHHSTFLLLSVEGPKTDNVEPVLAGWLAGSLSVWVAGMFVRERVIPSKPANWPTRLSLIQ